MEEKQTEEKKTGWSGPVIVFFILIVIALPIVKRMATTTQMKSDKATNSIGIINEIPSNPEKEKADSGKPAIKYDRYEFYYDTVMIAKFEGTKMASSRFERKAGYILFKDKTIVLTNYLNEEEIYPIMDVKKVAAGGYLFITNHPDGENCTISVLQNRGNNIVVLHFTEVNSMIYFFIKRGFTMDLKIYNQKLVVN